MGRYSSRQPKELVKCSENRKEKKLQEKKKPSYKSPNEGRKHSKVSLLYCANCPFKSKEKHTLVSHMSRHLVKAKFRCSFCSYSSNFQSATNSHQWIHPEYKRNIIYQCIYCSYQTRIQSHFERHQIVHARFLKDYKLAVFNCTFCPYKCVYKSSLDRHNLAHERKYGIQCNFCSYTATTIGGITLHKKFQHNEDKKFDESLNKKYKCTTCAYQTNKQNHYSRHLGTHINNQNIFECTSCTFKCSSSQAWKRHNLGHKSNISGFQCNKCSFWCKQLTTLDNHTLTVHNEIFQEVKLFSCPSCSYTAVKQSDFNRHFTRHQNPNEISWFLCNECPFKAKRKYQLADHCKNHRVNKGVVCSYCSYHSSSKTSSLYHMKLHL